MDSRNKLKSHDSASKTAGTYNNPNNPFEKSFMTAVTNTGHKYHSNSELNDTRTATDLQEFMKPYYQNLAYQVEEANHTVQMQQTTINFLSDKLVLRERELAEIKAKYGSGASQSSKQSGTSYKEKYNKLVKKYEALKAEIDTCTETSETYSYYKERYQKAKSQSDQLRDQIRKLQAQNQKTHSELRSAKQDRLQLEEQVLQLKRKNSDLVRKSQEADAFRNSLQQKQVSQHMLAVQLEQMKKEKDELTAKLEQYRNQAALSLFKKTEPAMAAGPKVVISQTTEPVEHLYQRQKEIRELQQKLLAANSQKMQLLENNKALTLKIQELSHDFDLEKSALETQIQHIIRNNPPTPHTKQSSPFLFKPRQTLTTDNNNLGSTQLRRESATSHVIKVIESCQSEGSIDQFNFGQISQHFQPFEVQQQQEQGVARKAGGILFRKNFQNAYQIEELVKRYQRLIKYSKNGNEY